jgi:hypothetical protein
VAALAKEVEVLAEVDGVHAQAWRSGWGSKRTVIVAEASPIRVIDVDTHVSEPEDLWTSRVSVKKWGDLVSHVVWDDEIGLDVWVWAGQSTKLGTAHAATAGWRDRPPSHPPRLADADPAPFDPVARLRRMDEYGIYAHVILSQQRRVWFWAVPSFEGTRADDRLRSRLQRLSRRLAHC